MSEILDILDGLSKQNTLIDPTTNLPVQQTDKTLPFESISEKIGPKSQETPMPVMSDRDVSSYEKRDIPLGINTGNMDDMRANRQSTLDTSANALLKFAGKTAINVGDTLGGLIVGIPSMIRNGSFSAFFDNEFHRVMDKASNWMENVMPIYETKAQEEENFWGKLNNAKFWGDGVLGGLSFIVGAVLSEMALSAITASTFGAGAPAQAAETATLISRGKKIFSLFGKQATSAELKALAKDVGKSLLVGSGYEAGVEARSFLDTARQNYIDQYRQQYGTEPPAELLAKADSEIKKTANSIFGVNMALLSIDYMIQFKNIFGKGLSTDLKLFGKEAVKREGKDFALRGTLEASYETASKLRKTLYTVPKLLKNPLNEGFEEGTQGLFQSMGQDYIKKKYDALGYNEAFSYIDSINKNMKDAYLSEDAGIGFIIGAMGIPGMGIATGKFKEAKGFGDKLIASFEGGIAEVFEENRAEKEAINNAIKLSSKVNIDNVLEQLRAASVNYATTQQRDAALENGDFFEAKNAESDALFSFVKTRDNLGLLNDSKEQYATMIKNMDNADFAKTFGYDKVDVNDKELNDSELSDRKKKVIDAFNKKIDNFQETKSLASKVAPIRNFNDENARLYNEAIHHLMYTTNDLDDREDSMVKSLKEKLSKTKDIDGERVKELMNFHNTWYNLTQGEYSKELQAYTKDVKALEETRKKMSLMDAASSGINTEWQQLDNKRDKLEKRIKHYESIFQTELSKFNENKDKLANYGFNINYNFKDMDSFKQAVADYDNLKKDIETHLNQNIFDKTDVNQTLEDLQKVQNKRHELIGTYNHLNTKEGEEAFKTQISETKRQFKIALLKLKAEEFLHNQGVEMDKDTEKEIEKNVDLQIEENDDEITKEIKSQLSEIISAINDETDIDKLNSLIEDLNSFKEFDLTPELVKVINNNVKEAKDKIKSIENKTKEAERTQQELKKKPVFEEPKRMLKLFNDSNSEQFKNFYNAVAEINDSNLSKFQKEEKLKQRISFKLIEHENPNTPEEAKQKDIDNEKNNNDNVTQVNGIRTEGVTPFNFKMEIDGKPVGGFMMPNQIYIKHKDGSWQQIDFSKLEDDVYLKWLLPQLFPQDLVSTQEDRLELGKYLKEHNELSNKLSKVFSENVTKTNYSFDELDKELGGLLDKNNFSSQIEMNIDDSKTSRNIDEILDNADDLMTKAATIEVDSQKIMLFGKATATGKGFSKKFFVRVVNGKLERNPEGKVIWNEVEGSPLQTKISDFLEDKYKKDKTDYIDTSHSLFSLLVFEPKGYIRTIFTTNETIGKIQDDNNDIVIKFNKNKKNFQPITNKIGDTIKKFFTDYADKKKGEIKDEFINDFFITVKNANDSKVEITPVITNEGQLQFRVKNNEKKVVFVDTYIFFNGTNFVKLNVKDKPEAKQINADYRNGEITLRERFEKLKPYFTVINDLNENIGELFLDGYNLKEEDFNNDEKKNYSTVLTAVRKATKTNDSKITGFYKDILVSNTNQQDLENLQIKQDLNYFLYLKPGNSDFLDIRDFVEKIKNKTEQKRAEEAKKRLSKKESDVVKTNTEKVEKQEEATTVEEVISNSPDATVKGAATILNMLNPVSTTDVSNLSDDELIVEAGKNIGLSDDNPITLTASLARNSKLRAEFERLKALKSQSKTEVKEEDSGFDGEKSSQSSSKEVVIETPNIDKLKGLGFEVTSSLFTKTEDQLKRIYNRNKGDISFEEFQEIVKNASSEYSTDGVNKLLQLSEKDLMEYNQAVKNLMQILPIKTKDNPDGIIEITDVLDILKNLKTKGEVGGRFITKLKTIYLASFEGKSVKGVEYHEAFHAVFRLLLTDSRITKYLKAAEGLYGTPTEEQLKELRNSSSDLVNLSKEDLKNLWLEEKMADAFMDYVKGQSVEKVVTQSWLVRIFNKIMNLLKGIFETKKDTQSSNERAITQLFSDIYQGKFKDAKEKYPVQRAGVKQSDVNKLLKQSYSIKLANGKHIEKKGYLSHSISEAIINTTTNEIAKILKENKQSELTVNDEINKVIKAVRERFNFENEYNSKLLDTLSDDMADKLVENLSSVYRSLAPDSDNIDIIISEVNERLPLYNLTKEATTVQEKSDEDINDSESIEDDNGDGDGFLNKKTNEINHAWEKASKRVKQYISSVSMKTDLFNIGEPFVKFMEEQETQGNTELTKNYEFAIRGSYLYSNLIKMLVNTPSYKMVGMVYSMADMSPEMKYFVQHWFKDIYTDLQKKMDIPLVNTNSLEELYDVLKNIPYSKLNNNSEHFTFMASDLEKNRIFLWDVLFDESGVTKFLNANNREVAKQVFNRWEKNWESRRINDLVSFKKVISDYEEIYKNGSENILDEYVNILKDKPKKLQPLLYVRNPKFNVNNIESDSQRKARETIQLYEKFNREFKRLGIELPSAFVKYSLINHIVSINQQQLLSEKQLDWYNNFSASGIKPINKETIENISLALKNAKKAETYTIYSSLTKEKTESTTLGAVGRLKDIAESVGMFDPTVIPSSFNNQEGKRIYDIVPPSDISRRLNLLKDTVNVNLLKEYIKTKNARAFKDAVLNNDINNTYYFYSFFTTEQQVDNFLQTIDNNPLLKDADEKTLDNIFSTLSMSYAGGIRQDVFETKVKDNSELKKDKEDKDDIEVTSKGYGLFSDADGKSYSNADIPAKILYQLSLLADSEYNKYNIKTVNDQKFAYYKFTQPESKSTVPLVLLPFNQLTTETGITQKAKEMLFSMFKQEYDRIGKVQGEIDEFVNGKKSGYVENYHYVNQDFGIEGTNSNNNYKVFTKEGKYYYLDIKNGNKVIELKEEQFWYNEKQDDGSFIRKPISKSKLVPRGIKFFNFGNEKAGLNKFVTDALKNKILTVEDEVEINTQLERFIDTQFEDFLTLLKQTDIGIIKVNDENKEVANLLPAGFLKENSKEVDRAKLKNAFLNDYIMSYSINGLMYGDNANVAKDAVDWVKRAGGIIGSGNNYGSGESNVILMKSEIKDGIDTTDAQTFSNPFWNLVTILKNKGAYDEKIINIYKKIDGGLEEPSYDEYQYLYDNQAQHQPNKTQGYGFEHYLKTSISPILRGESSRLKKYVNKEDVLKLHEKLFKLKLEHYDTIFNPKFKDDVNTIAYFEMLNEYHDMFEAIPGKESKHNMLNISEQHDGLMVYDSAWKRNKTNVHDIENGKPYLYRNQNEDGSITDVIEPIRIANASMVDQQKTDGVKSKTIDGTQKQRLIVTEQDKQTIVKFKDMKVTIDTVLNTIEKLQALRIKRGFEALKKEIIDEDGNEQWETLLQSFQESIQASSSDPQQLELFQIENGKPKYNLNNPAIETKFQAMFLSFVSNDTLKHKTAGSKFTLMSEAGFNLMRELDDEGNIIRTLTNRESKNLREYNKSKYIATRLRHDVEVKEYKRNEKGEISTDRFGKPIYKIVEYYSEIVVSERFLKKFGFTKEQFYKGEIPEEFLYIQGIRIPTEDKHSMVNAKIVDILPDSYGNVIMLPYEIVNLSGADFDIDSLYAKVNQTYTNLLTEKTELYGSYLSKPTLEEAYEQAYNEHLADAFEDRKVSATFNDLKENNEELKTLYNEKLKIENLLKKNNEQLKESSNIYTSEFIKNERQDIIKELNKTKDEIKSLELALLEQSFDINKIEFNKEKWIGRHKGIIEKNYNYYRSEESSDLEKIDPLTKGELNNYILELERKLTNNYGNNKIANTPTSLEIFKKLVKVLDKEGLIKKEMGYGVHDMLSKIKADMAISTGAANIGPAALFNNLFGLLVKYNVTTENPVLASTAFELLSLDKNNQEIIDEKEKQRIQDTLASVLAAMTDNTKEQLADVFNLTINTLPVALTMIATGNNFDNVMLLMKNPIVKRIAELSSEFNKTVQSTADYKNSRKERMSIKEKIIKEFGLSDAMFDGDLTYDVLMKSLKAQTSKAKLWSEIGSEITAVHSDITEEMYNSLTEQEKDKLIECL